MFKRGCGLEFLLVLCGLELSRSCPRHCICYTGPSTVSCQSHNFLSVPEGIPPHSERIFLQNNKIHRLLRGHFSPTTVTLWIYSNNISYIEPSAFHGFHALEELDLGDNRHLRQLDAETFRGLGKLHALHLYRCGLDVLPTDLFKGLRNLQYLYLQDNHLGFLQDDMFVDLHNLSHLFLHGNRLWRLHQNTFRGLGALDRLLLHHNRLEWVDQRAFHDLRRLTTLYLFNNSLRELSGESLTQLPALEYLRLNDNPWECDCKALSLWDWLKKFRGSTSEVGCVAPAKAAGKDLKQLHKEDFPNCSGSESLSQGNTWTGSSIGNSKVSPKKEPTTPHGRPDHHHRHGGGGGGAGGGGLHPSPPSPLPHPPTSINGREQPGGGGGALSPPRASGGGGGGGGGGRSRNCTRQRTKGGKGRGGQNEVMVDKEYASPDGGGGKDDPTTPDGHTPRRKHKCTPRTSMRPPSGVQLPTDRAAGPQAWSLLLCCLLAVLTPLATELVVLR